MAESDLLKEINAKVDRILRALYGNGQPNEGLISQTALNTSFRENAIKSQRVIVGGIITAILTGLGSLFLELLKRL